jgi:hypothetical protein
LTGGPGSTLAADNQIEDSTDTAYRQTGAGLFEHD